MLGRRQGCHQLSKQVIKTILGFGPAYLGQIGLGANDEFKLRHNVGERFALLAQHVLQCLTQRGKLRFVLRKQNAYQFVHGLHQCKIGHRPLKLIELAFDKIAAVARYGLVYFANQCRFSGARISRNEHNFFTAICAALVGGQQLFNFGLAAVQFLSNQKLARKVAGCQFKLGAGIAVF